MPYHSERAKEGTRSQLQRIINFLKAGVLELEIELGETNNFFFKRAVQKNLSDRKAQLFYYQLLWDEYKEGGLI